MLCYGVKVCLFPFFLYIAHSLLQLGELISLVLMLLLALLEIYLHVWFGILFFESMYSFVSFRFPIIYVHVSNSLKEIHGYLLVLHLGN